MDEIILFNRLVTMATAVLGPNFTSDLAKLAAVVMTFIENEVEYVLSSSEKLVLFENYFKKLVSSIQLSGLEAETMTLIKSFVGLICKASKGQLSINNGSAKVMATRASAQAAASVGTTSGNAAATKDPDSNSLNGTKKKSLFRRS